MKRRNYLFLFSCFICFVVKAQSVFEWTLNKEGKIIAVPKKKEYVLNIPAFSYETYTPPSTLELDKKLREFTPDYQPTSIDERPMNMQVLSAAYRPFFNVYAPMIRRVSPMAFDFSETYYTPLRDNLAFAINGTQYTWPGGGGLIRLSPGLIWNKDRWTISGGGFVTRYSTPFNLSPELTVGANVNVRYEATDWLALRTWGQYAYYDTKERYNPHMILNPFYNHTNIGGAAEIKVNENFGIGFGVNYEYNHWKRKLEPQYLFYPVFKSKGIQISIQ